VGWLGGQDWYTLNEDTTSDHSGLVFYYVPRGEPPRLLSAFEQQGQESTSFWKSLGWKVSGETVLKAVGVPSNIPYGPFHTDLLAFWTDTAWVDLRWKKVESYYYNSKVEAQISVGDISAYCRWNQIPAGTRSHSEEKAFPVVIGAKQVYFSKTTTNNRRRHLNVLLVSMDGDVAYRRGLCEVEESDWIALPVRQWKPVFLA
jgi:hypothetical protein